MFLKKLRLLTTLVVYALMISCIEGSLQSDDPPTVSGPDSATNSEFTTDRDQELNSDSPEDTGIIESDIDVRPDTDTDVDTGIDTGTETDTRGIDSDSIAETDTACDTDCDTGTNLETSSDTVLDTESDTIAEDPPFADLCTSNQGPVISALSVEHNPNSTLSCYVTWQTDVPATSTVYFGDRAYSYRIADNTMVTDHRVLLIGLHAQTTYRIKAVSLSTDPEGESFAKTTYQTGALPDIVPRCSPGPDGTVFTNDAWTLLNLNDVTTTPQAPTVAAMYDDFGEPVWYFIDGESSDSRGDIDVRLLDNEHILIGASDREPAREIDLAGNIVWEGPIQQGSQKMHHHFDKTLDGNFLTLRHVLQNGVRGDMVHVFSPEFETQWKWNLFDYVTPPQDASGDWSHANSVTLDEANRVFYLNFRNISTLFKISMDDEKNILWRLGADGDFTPDPNAAFPWFARQHDPEIQPDGNILVYDNGDDSRPYSRVIEYALDEETMQSEIVFEFPGNFQLDDPWYREEWYFTIFGDADRLENGNIQVAAGTQNTGAESRVFEITPEGEVVRELRLPQKNGRAIGVYRAERLLVPPHIEVLCDPRLGCALEGCAASDEDFNDTLDTDSGDGGVDLPDAGFPVDAGLDTDTGTETEIPLFPMEWNFDTDLDDFVTDDFTHNPVTGSIELEHTFTGNTESAVVYKELYGQDWNGFERIEIRLRSASASGRYILSLISGYGWAWCNMYIDPKDIADWTVVTMDLQSVCGENNFYPEMVQQFGVVATPDTASVLPQLVQLEIDSIMMLGSN